MEQIDRASLTRTNPDEGGGSHPELIPQLVSCCINTLLLKIMDGKSGGVLSKVISEGRRRSNSLVRNHFRNPLLLKSVGEHD